MKPWYRSKTLIVNALIAVGVAAEANWPTLQPFLGEGAYPMGAFAIALINIFLRTITTQPLGSSKGQP